MLPLLSWKKSLLVGLLVCGANLALGQNYPNKPLRVVTGTAGSGADFSARSVATGLANAFGQPAVVENRTAIIIYETVAKAPPDGYTVGVSGSSMWIGPLFREVSYDVINDFTPISMVSSVPNLLVVHPSVPANSIKELIAYAKATPAGINWSHSGVGGSSHLGAELFKSMTGINVVHVPYKGTPQTVTAVISGEAQMTGIEANLVMPHIKAGKLKGLAVTSLQPSALAPGLTTVAASGLPGYEVVTVTTIFGPAKIPAPILTRINQEVVRLLNKPEVKEQFLTIGADTIPTSPEEYAAKIKSEMTKWGKLIKDAGIKVK